ncbi:UDP-N-acetylmuramoyl-L-alanine--D-glutamate ligase [Candidatus Gracilibacteria bacterium]|nr:UDP-N-acetylmuramoyl-L-alanine--D-glutamate ligase [Candidatus Gracilibacteria bacterium]
MEGKSSERFLKEKCPNVEIKIFDDHNPSFGSCVSCEFKRACQDADAIVVSAGISREKVAEEYREKCTSNVEMFFHNIGEKSRKKIIAIGGTKGKSTTTKFCAEFLNEAGLNAKIGGNYGTPLLDLFDDIENQKIEYIVAELSSFQLEHLNVSPHIAIFLNLFPDHLDRHGDIKEYFSAKQNLWRHQTKEDFLIVPEVFLDPIAHTHPKGRLLSAPSLEKETFPEHSIFRANHFLENFGTVAFVGQILQIELTPHFLAKTAEQFTGLPHRLELFAEKNNVRFYNDSISTNVGSALAAIEFFQDSLGSIILGGQDRKQDFSYLCETLPKIAPNAFVIVYESEISPLLIQTLKEHDVPFYSAKTLEEAAEIAVKKTPKKSHCVFSPAAPSFDVFKNYIERGNLWKEYVNNLTK